MVLYAMRSRTCSAIRLERVGMSRCARYLIDGRGPDRMVNALEVMLHPATGVRRTAGGVGLTARMAIGEQSRRHRL